MLLDVFLPMGLAVIMFGLGTTLTPEDFRRVFTAPKGIAIGLANLLVVSPLLALGVAELFDLDPIMAVGLVLLGAAPGGAMANVLTHLAKAETALSVSLTAISSVLAAVTIPLWLGIAIDVFDPSISDDVDMLGVVIAVFSITVIPVALGMYCRIHRPERASQLQPRLGKIVIFLFFVIVAAAVISEWDRLTDNFEDVALAALTLNLLTMSLSFTVATLARLPSRQATAIAMELGMHNATLTIAVATTITDELAIPGAVYSLFMFVNALLFARFMAKRNAEPARVAAGS